LPVVACDRDNADAAAALLSELAAQLQNDARSRPRPPFSPVRGLPAYPVAMTGDVDLETKLGALLRFIDAAPLTDTIADLEYALEGQDVTAVARVLDDRGVAGDVLEAALFARQRLGRISDIIHAVAVSLALPRMLQPGETLRRPSLAAGNDPSRPFDIETDRRIAEFKLARWDGHDAMRKRQLFKDLVHLAADTSGRSAELYVAGDRPLRFLDTTRASAAWALNRFPSPALLFEQRFGDPAVAIADFRAARASHVRVINLQELLPELRL
jgi:hypothetical protein